MSKGAELINWLLIHFDQIWSFLINFDHFWSFFWSFLIIFDHFWSFFDHFWSFLIILISSAPLIMSCIQIRTWHIFTPKQLQILCNIKTWIKRFLRGIWACICVKLFIDLQILASTRRQLNYFINFSI